jgi:hypothetical protein
VDSHHEASSPIDYTARANKTNRRKILAVLLEADCDWLLESLFRATSPTPLTPNIFNQSPTLSFSMVPFTEQIVSGPSNLVIYLAICLGVTLELNPGTLACWL